MPVFDQPVQPDGFLEQGAGRFVISSMRLSSTVNPENQCTPAGIAQVFCNILGLLEGQD
jgi:hypothetical protein